MNTLIQDPTDPSVWFIGHATDGWGIPLDGLPCLVNVHPASACAGESCVVHNPSSHHMREWTLNWRGDRGLMERLCPHGIGHPDPDSLAFHVLHGQEWQGVHGCDGCCRLSVSEHADRQVPHYRPGSTTPEKQAAAAPCQESAASPGPLASTTGDTLNVRTHPARGKNRARRVALRVAPLAVRARRNALRLFGGRS